MDKLRFGTAGIPLSAAGGTTQDGIRKVRELGLDGLEMEFVHSVYLTEEKAKEVASVRKQEDIVLTAYSPYYINLNAAEKAKMHASMERIVNTARITSLAGGYSITFHSGFYMGGAKEKVYEEIKKRVQDIVKQLQDEGNAIWVRPELTGKETQFGDIDEILKLSQDVEQVMPSIDFAHQYARYAGRDNSYTAFSGILEKVEKSLGKEGLAEMHIHMSGIAYGPKGEKNHLLLEKSGFAYKEVLRALKEFKAKGIVVCESPVIEQDALVLKKEYSSMQAP